MKVALIKHYLEDYSNSFGRNGETEVPILVENYDNFQANWDIEELDFGAMYNRSLESTLSRRLWKQSDYYPKEAISAFIDEDKEFVRTMFRDLTKVERDVDMRVSKFLFCCDELLVSLKTKPTNKILDHYHGDKRMIGAYLTFLFPEQFFITDFPTFMSFLRRIESAAPLHSLDIDRVGKVMKILTTFIRKEEKLLAQIAEKNQADGHSQAKMTFWISDFVRFVAMRNLAGQKVVLS